MNNPHTRFVVSNYKVSELFSLPNYLVETCLLTEENSHLLNKKCNSLIKCKNEGTFF